MATINQAVPTRRVQTSAGGYYYFNRYATVSVTEHTSSTTETESGSKSGGISATPVGLTETFTGTIIHTATLTGPNGKVTYPGYATIRPGGEILRYSLIPMGMSVSAGGTGDTYITFGKDDWGEPGGDSYSVRITYKSGKYSGLDSGSWGHTLSGISISNEWCSDGTLSVSVNPTGYSVSITNSSVTNPYYSFNYSGDYETTTTSYYGTGSMQYYGDIMSVTTNFGSVSYSTSGWYIYVNVSASSSGTARVTANLRDYSSPTYANYADVRFTGYYANGAKANNVLANYVNFNGEVYP